MTFIYYSDMKNLKEGFDSKDMTCPNCGNTISYPMPDQMSHIQCKYCQLYQPIKK